MPKKSACDWAALSPHSTHPDAVFTLQDAWVCIMSLLYVLCCCVCCCILCQCVCPLVVPYCWSVCLSSFSFFHFHLRVWQPQEPLHTPPDLFSFLMLSLYCCIYILRNYYCCDERHHTLLYLYIIIFVTSVTTWLYFTIIISVTSVTIHCCIYILCYYDFCDEHHYTLLYICIVLLLLLGASEIHTPPDIYLLLKCSEHLTCCR